MPDQVLASARIGWEGDYRKDPALKPIKTSRDVDVAVMERKALEEFGALAEHWVDRLPADSEVREEISRLLPLAPPREAAA